MRSLTSSMVCSVAEAIVEEAVHQVMQLVHLARSTDLGVYNKKLIGE